METKVDKQRMERVRRSYDFLNGIDIEAEEERAKEQWRFTGFYGSPYVHNKSGDFNEIMYSFEKVGGIRKEESKMQAFREALEECQLEDLGYSGVWFTWERRNLPETNIRERLDRGVSNDKWRSLFPAGNVKHLTHTMSDHCPLFLNTGGEIFSKRSLKFKFEARWLLEETCEKAIKESWKLGTGTVVERLERLQTDLMAWASMIKIGRERLKARLIKHLDMLTAKERNDNVMAKIIDTKVHLNIEIDKDEMYWEQKARANWLKAWDKNLTFFHRFAAS
ncbi:hypothetical protein Gohar_027467 [Gossypium harknessii]|uniref:Reverse transcriptase n=1 Tax=Gossypium harknessii TaxID=34285 RepID=A0A7J9HUX4_9ROSI|nr:hypothetical protein [Gossypium harknessii]